MRCMEASSYLGMDPHFHLLSYSFHSFALHIHLATLCPETLNCMLSICSIITYTYINTFQFAPSFFALHRSPSPDLKSPTRSRKNMRSKEVQTGLDVGLHYHWTMNTPNEVVDCDYLMSHADPTSIATHVVSSEALEGDI